MLPPLKYYLGTATISNSSNPSVTQKRITLLIGDFLKLQRMTDASEEPIGRVTGIFTHDILPGSACVFIYMNMLDHIQVEDPILLLSQMILSQILSTVVVGLPAVCYNKQYLVGNQRAFTRNGGRREDRGRGKSLHTLYMAYHILLTVNLGN